MKITLKSLVVASSLLLVSVPAFAHGDAGGAGRGGRTPADRAHMLEEQLGLTEAQEAKITAIYTAEADALKVLREKKLDPKVQREEIKTLRTTYRAQVVAELTEEQKVKFEALAAQGP